MRLLVLALTVLVLSGGTSRAADGDSRLSVTSLDGVLLVFPPDAGPYPIEGPTAAGIHMLVPGSIVQVTAGRATFDSDLHARLFARSGSIFRFGVAEPSSRNGLRVSALSDAAPLDVQIGAAKLTLSRGGRVAVYDGGCVEVEGSAATLAPGHELRAGESMRVSMFRRPGGGLTPGDGLALNVPPRGAGPSVASNIGRPERPMTLSGAELGRNPFLFDPEDETLRNAMSDRPTTAPAQWPPACPAGGRE
ncbi:hypothetical protein EPO15_17325 [bacterium]|nr:MAG: hypothetical protein EPO15_17325 [bacterium]